MKQLGILVTVLALSAAVISPARADMSAAENAFARATKLFTERSYREAIEAFEEAYKLRPHFLVQCSIARCYQNMNDYLKSARHYQRCLDEGAGKAKIGARVRKSLAKVEARLASIEVKSPGEGGVVHLDGREVQAAPATLRVNPGAHVVEVRREGATPANKTLQCSPGGAYALTLRPKALRAARPEPRVTDRPAASGAVKRKPLHQGWFWGAVALTTALSVTFAVLGSRTVSAHTDYYDNPTEEGYDSFVSRKALTNVFVGLAAAAAASSAVLFFFTDFGGGGEQAQDGEDRVTTVGLGLRGTF